MFGALNEELNRAIVFRFRLIPFRQGQSLHFEEPFPLQAQLLARSDQHFDVMGLLQDFTQKVPAIEQVLHVVEDKQDFFVVQGIGELNHQVCRAGKADAQHVCNRRQDGFGHADTSQ